MEEIFDDKTEFAKEKKKNEIKKLKNVTKVYN